MAATQLASRSTFEEEMQGLLSQAQQETGLSDFGGDEFLPGLRVVATDLADQSLPPQVVQASRDTVLQLLEKRLRFLARYAATPAIAAERIERPVFVIGLPRTGTTALVDVMAQDPATRAPLQWELEHLTELSDPTTWADDPRIEACEARLQEQGRSNPVVALGLHNYGARLPDECNTFMAMSLWTPNISVRAHLPAYSAWLGHAHVPGAYLLHKSILQYLQHFGRKGRWLLKSPFHVFDLPAILAAYPDAVFIQPHRDPMHVMPSMCGLHAHIRGEISSERDRHRTAREITKLWGTGVERASAARRDPAVDARVLDVSHGAFVKDPQGVLASIYERLDWSYDEEVSARVRRWIDMPTQHMSSVKFTLEDFGLSRSQIDEDFGEYRARYGHLF